MEYNCLCSISTECMRLSFVQTATVYSYVTHCTTDHIQLHTHTHGHTCKLLLYFCCFYAPRSQRKARPGAPLDVWSVNLSNKRNERSELWQMTLRQREQCFSLLWLLSLSARKPEKLSGFYISYGVLYLFMFTYWASDCD